jgi:ribosome-associated heat shock protein Hsp15
MSSTESVDSIRLDRWLFAARAYRSRSLAAQACSGGKVAVNDGAAKPHKLIRVGDLVQFTLERGKREWRVLALAERRGPAAVARTLYEDLTPAPAPQVFDSFVPRRERGTGRPTKRERRQLERFR